jgi:hypothetical protein
MSNIPVDLRIFARDSISISSPLLTYTINIGPYAYDSFGNPKFYKENTIVINTPVINSKEKILTCFATLCMRDPSRKQAQLVVFNHAYKCSMKKVVPGNEEIMEVEEVEVRNDNNCKKRKTPCEPMKRRIEYKREFISEETLGSIASNLSVEKLESNEGISFTYSFKINEEMMRRIWEIYVPIDLSYCVEANSL